MTLLASIPPPLCKILSHNGTTGTAVQVPVQSLALDLSSTTPTFTYSHHFTQSNPYKIKGATVSVCGLAASVAVLSWLSFCTDLCV